MRLTDELSCGVSSLRRVLLNYHPCAVTDLQHLFPRHPFTDSSSRAVSSVLENLGKMSIPCPAGWTSSPASLARDPRCYLVPPERPTSLFRCVSLCKEHGGAPACIGSAEENDFVTAELTAADDLWLGLYQNETGLGPAKGWGRCVTGDAPSFSNWY